MQQRVGGVANRLDRQAVGGQRQRQDRRVGGVHLRVCRRIRQVQRQRPGRRVDRRLHVLRGRIHRAVQIELQGDLTGALRTLRCHQQQPGDLPELPFQRRGDQRLGGFRTGARQLGDDLDGGEIDLRQRRDRQRPVTQRTGQQDPDRQQPGGDRPSDERRRNVHPCDPGISGILPAFDPGTLRSTANRSKRHHRSRSGHLASGSRR
jgi:hypothetical protein